MVQTHLEKIAPKAPGAIPGTTCWGLVEIVHLQDLLFEGLRKIVHFLLLHTSVGTELPTIVPPVKLLSPHWPDK